MDNRKRNKKAEASPEAVQKPTETKKGTLKGKSDSQKSPSKISQNHESNLLKFASTFSKIIPTSFKVKHLVLLPTLAFLQIIVYYFYLQKTERIMTERSSFLEQQLKPDEAAHRGDYRALYKFQKSSTYDQVQQEDLTVVTQCSVNNLHYLIDMSARWQGQISVAVFTPKNDAIITLYAINAIRRCFPDVRDLVTFSIVWPTNKGPIFEENPPAGLSSPECSEVYQALKSIPGQNYAKTSIPYPHNTLRNVARYELNTKLMFLLDIDTVPARGSREQFLNFAQKRDLFGEGAHLIENTVYVTPAFEVLEDVEPPADKTGLLNLLESERIRPFHNETCWYCHKTTRYEDWIQVPQENQLAISYEVDWEQSWEPYYISLTNIPEHDERFKQYGYDRISQICELFMADYRFFVLNNLFTVHQGYKRLGGFHMEKNIENRKNFLIFEDQFQPDMQSKYPDSNRTCRQRESWTSRDGRAQVRININDHLKNLQKRNIAK